jgi:hypothetical protein
MKKYQFVQALFMASMGLTFLSMAQPLLVAPSSSSNSTRAGESSTSKSKESSETDDGEIDELAATYPVSTKLRGTRCMELEESTDNSLLVASFENSRLSFHISATDKDFQKFKNILKDACQNKKKVDLRYEASSQKIKMLRFSKK